MTTQPAQHLYRKAALTPAQAAKICTARRRYHKPLSRGDSLNLTLCKLKYDYDRNHPGATYATIGRLSPDEPVTEDEPADRYPLPGSYRPPPVKKQSLTKDAYAELVAPYAGWWTMAQVAHALKVDLMTITNYRKRGLLACVDITGGITKTNKRKWFVHPHEAARFIAQHKAVTHG